MRSLKYYMATTLDGFICRQDGGLDDFNAVPPGAHIADYLESLSSFDAVIMGRKTYDVGLAAGKTNPYPQLKTYVVTRSLQESPDEAVSLISSDVVGRVEALKHEKGGDIYLCGGAELAAQLFDAGLIDEVIVKLMPLIIGAGISLAQAVGARVELERTALKAYDSGVVFLYYRVKKPTG